MGWSGAGVLLLLAATHSLGIVLIFGEVATNVYGEAVKLF